MKGFKRGFLWIIVIGFIFSCGGGGGGGGSSNSASDAVKEPILTTILNVNCTSSVIADCAASMDGKPVNGGLTSGSCSDLLSGSGPDFSYIIGDGTGPKYTSCNDVGCVIETDEWAQVMGESFSVVNKVADGTYTVALFVDSAPEENNPEPSDGDLLFCKEGIVIGEDNGEFAISDADYLDPVDYFGSQEIVLSISCSSSGDPHCSDSVVSTPGLSGSFVSGRTCANIFDSAFSADYSLDVSAQANCNAGSCSYSSSYLYDETGGVQATEVLAGDYAFIAYINADNNGNSSPDETDVVFCKEFSLASDGEQNSFVLTDSEIIAAPVVIPRTFSFDISCTALGDIECSSLGLAGIDPSIQGGIVYGISCASWTSESPDARIQSGELGFCSLTGCDYSNASNSLYQDALGGGEEAVSSYTDGAHAFVAYFDNDNNGTLSSGDTKFCQDVNFNSSTSDFTLTNADLI